MTIEKSKLNTLNKLIDSGINTEKKISSLGIQEILAVPKITVPEIHIITELQAAIKARKVISYLASADDIEEKTEMNAADSGAEMAQDYEDAKPYDEDLKREDYDYDRFNY